MLPRPVLPGESVMITRRCTQRSFLLRPDDETNQTYLYVLGLAAQHAKVELMHAVTVSNHEHVEAYDRHGTRVEFYQYLHEQACTFAYDTVGASPLFVLDGASGTTSGWPTSPHPGRPRRRAGSTRWTYPPDPQLS
jgi:hypothetical protein